MRPIELSELKKQKRCSPIVGLLIGAVLGGVTAVGLLAFLDGGESRPAVADPVTGDSDSTTEVPPQPGAPVTDDEMTTPAVDNPKEDRRVSLASVRPLVAPKPEPIIASTVPDFPDVPPLRAEKPKLTIPVAAVQQKVEEEEKPRREEIRLTKRWTVLALIPDGVGEGPLPESLNVWNYEKGYSFRGPKGKHNLGNYRVDGEFILRNGYIRREFGNSALLHLPKAEDFELEGIIKVSGEGGWLVLLGWDIESKSGYVIYHTRLRVSGTPWRIVEIRDGKAVEGSKRVLVDRDTPGQGALRVLVDKKRVSMQAAGKYLFRNELMPNYKEGHVAIGTYRAHYGPRSLGIKSLRMRAR